ncbi:MAG: sigma factor [Planctomycetota bacterium]
MSPAALLWRLLHAPQAATESSPQLDRESRGGGILWLPRARAPPALLETLLTHTPWLCALARGLLLDPERADDVVQQTWLVALERPPRTAHNLRAWLGAVARNVVRQSCAASGGVRSAR